MAADQGGTGRPAENPGQPPVWHTAGELLNNEEDERVLRDWRESLILQDPRYKSKVLLKFAALAMVDEQFRSRLVNDTEGVLGELRSRADLPEGVTVKFYENTPGTLNVVLPPRGGEMSTRPAPLREQLRSRTANAELPFDDFNIGNFDSIDMFGDDDDKDHPATPPRTLPL
jgi:hypothetical protein